MNNQNEEFDLEKEENINNTNNINVVPVQDNIIYCPNCGRPYSKNSRCCMHCGQINYEHEANSGMNKSFVQGEKIKEKEEKREEKKNFVIKKIVKTSDAKFSENESDKAKMYKVSKFINKIILVILIVLFIFNFDRIVIIFNNFRSSFIISQVDKMIIQIDRELDSEDCVKTGGEIIYSFDSSDDLFKTNVSLYTFNFFNGYIRVIPDGESYKYYVSISDGKYGFTETLYSEDLDYKIVSEVGVIENRPSSTDACVK